MLQCAKIMGSAWPQGCLLLILLQEEVQQAAALGLLKDPGKASFCAMKWDCALAVKGQLL